MRRDLVRWGAIFLLTFGASAPANLESELAGRFPYRGPRLGATNARADDTVDIGLYAGTGTWDTGKEHLKLFFENAGFKYRSLSAADVRGEGLAKVRLLFVPGGESVKYLAELETAGAEKIRAFVEAGGGYAGICAGAFYATSHRQGGPVTGPYGIGLLRATAYDGTSLGAAPFVDGVMGFDTVATAMMAGFEPAYRILMLGGPALLYDAEEARQKSVEVQMRFQRVGYPAMVTFRYGRGRVFLSAPHLEINPTLTNWEARYQDPVVKWPILERILRSLY